MDNTTETKIILVFGGTGQQGGAVATALQSQGWRVRALVRNIKSERAVVLAATDVETVTGDLSSRHSLKAAVQGCYGVFSVQPSSGQGTAYGASDDQEVHRGKVIPNIAIASGVLHFVYSTANAAGPEKSGVGHLTSKVLLKTMCVIRG
jgi:uncharacterized protein YbjT (DUF2867 family)